MLNAGTVRVWHSSTYRLETALNYGLERVWALAHLRGSNDVAIGYDEGSVIVKVILTPKNIFYRNFLLRTFLCNV